LTPFSKITRKFKQLLSLFRALVPTYTLRLKPLWAMVCLTLGLGGLFVVWWAVVVVFISGFYHEIPRELAFEILRYIILFDIALVGADVALTVGAIRTGTTKSEPRTSNASTCAAFTFFFITFSVLTAIVSMSYLDGLEYVTPFSFFWPSFFMLPSVVGVIWLLRLIL
jgi:hypothetical protein